MENRAWPETDWPPFVSVWPQPDLGPIVCPATCYVGPHPHNQAQTPELSVSGWDPWPHPGLSGKGGPLPTLERRLSSGPSSQVACLRWSPRPAADPSLPLPGRPALTGHHLPCLELGSRTRGSSQPFAQPRPAKAPGCGPGSRGASDWPSCRQHLEARAPEGRTAGAGSPHHRPLHTPPFSPPFAKIIFLMPGLDSAGWTVISKTILVLAPGLACPPHPQPVHGYVCAHVWM